MVKRTLLAERIRHLRLACGQALAEAIQSFVWQDYDGGMEFPQLSEFLDYRRTHLHMPLERITVQHKSLVSPGRMRHLDGRLVLH